MITKTVGVEGMSCGHCINWVSEALKRIDGVQEAKVNLDNQNAIVEYDEEKVTEQMIAETLEKAGYTATTFK